MTEDARIYRAEMRGRVSARRRCGARVLPCRARCFGVRISLRPAERYYYLMSDPHRHVLTESVARQHFMISWFFHPIYRCVGAPLRAIYSRDIILKKGLTNVSRYDIMLG